MYKCTSFVHLITTWNSGHAAVLVYQLEKLEKLNESIVEWLWYAKKKRNPQMIKYENWSELS